MARRPRIYLPGLSVHVFHRGHNRCPLFHERADYERFLTLLDAAVQHNGVEVHVFTLMSNHYHLIATPSSPMALPRAMKQLHSDYGFYYNRKHKRRGTIWDGRYEARNIQDPRYWWSCVRYIERNPLEACLADSLGEYEWSSYRVYAMGAESSWLIPHGLYEGLGNSPAERRLAYEAICKGSDTLQGV